MERAVDTQPESGIGDIESLKAHGVKRKLCPYYISRDLATKADLVFLPYNYLVSVLEFRIGMYTNAMF